MAVGEKLKTLPNPPKIIFSTGFDQFAVRAFELEAFDYILKPYTKTRLQATVIKLQKVLQNQSQQQLPSRCNFPIKLSIWNNNKLLVFNPKEEIYLIKTDTSKKILIYTNKGILESNLPLKTLEEKLCPCGFLRTHKSYIVNMNKVREIIPWFNDTYILTVENCLEKEIPVSRHFIQSFKTFLNL
jgi:DNA-binding LytR/AlgR family response regulator